MSGLRIATLAAWLAATASGVSAQAYVPLGSRVITRPDTTVSPWRMENFTVNKFRAAFMVESAMGADSGAPVAPSAAYPVCSPVPAIPAGRMLYNQTLLSAAAAGKLQIAFGHVNASGNEMVAVRDWSRVTRCVATDQKTVLLYGQVIRTTIAFSGLAGDIDVSLAALAANATINRKATRVTIEVDGLSSPAITAIIASVAQKDLTVETYADFARAEGQLLALVDSAGVTKTSERIGLVPPSDEYKQDVATAFALQMIGDGKTCQDALAAFRRPTDDLTAYIRGTYLSVTGVCNATTKPDGGQQVIAQQALMDLRVRY